jgi:Polysaccharide pyruvyl transferase
MAAIETNVAARGGNIIHRHSVGKPWETDPAALAAIEDADVVLVNGEGTIHHSAPAAASLARLAPHCGTRDKRCYLINAMIQSNKPEIMKDLLAFDQVWVRERRSAQEAEQAGVAAELCGDLSFFHDLPRHQGGESRGLALDSADPRITAEMAKIAAALKADFVAMRHNKKGMKAYKKQPLRWRYESGKPTALVRGVATFQQFAAFLSRRRYLVTGRFHGLCFAVNSRVPFAAVPLSVWKSESLLQDIGLAPKRLFRTGVVPKPFSAREEELISRYLVDIRGRIAAMFDCVLPPAGQAR